MKRLGVLSMLLMVIAPPLHMTAPAVQALTIASPAAGADPYDISASWSVDVQSLADKFGLSYDEALSRMNAREALNPSLSVIADNPDVFGGYYFTQDASDYTLHIVAKAGTQTPSIPLPTSGEISTAWETSPRSRTELDKLIASIIDTGIDYSTIEPDMVTGRLTITVPTAAAAAIANTNWSGEADIVIGPRLSSASCDSRLSCKPWRAGLYIEDASEICTSGFLGRGQNGDQSIKMLTAGHCGSGTWMLNLDTIGTTAKLTVDSYYDVQKIPNAGQTGSPYNRLYYDVGDKNYPISAVESNVLQGNGDYVNWDGITTGLHNAGTILNNNFHYSQIVGGTVRNNIGVKADDGHAVMGGDSGGPAYWAGKAMGLTSAQGPNGTTWDVYTFADFDAANVSVDICTSDNC